MWMCVCARAPWQVPRSQATSTLAAFDWPALYGPGSDHGPDHGPAALRHDTVPPPDASAAPAAASPAV